MQNIQKIVQQRPILQSYGRAIDYLRISLTDRCNLRCVYCMGVDGIESKLKRDDLLTLEEIADFARIACEQGVKRIRLTGGEPLVRLGIVDLVKELSKIPQLDDLSMTTNGQLFEKYGQDLKNAGLSRVTFSLDSTNPNTYKELTRGGDLEKVRAAIDLALKLGFQPVKINALAYRLTEEDLLEFVHMVKELPLHIRFIEYMPLGQVSSQVSSQVSGQASNRSKGQMNGRLITSYLKGQANGQLNGQLNSSQTSRQGGRETRKCPTPPSCKDIINTQELRSQLNSLCLRQGLGELVPLRGKSAPLGFGPASSYAFPHATGSFGFIGVHSQSFCKSCNRLRLTAEGKIRSCLFSDEEISVREALRAGSYDKVQAELLRAATSKPHSYKQQQGTKRAMSAIGG